MLYISMRVLQFQSSYNLVKMTTTFASNQMVQCEMDMQQMFDDECMLTHDDIVENEVFYTDEELKSIKVMPDETFYDTSDVFMHDQGPVPTAPPVPLTSHALLAWYLLDEAMTDDELTPALISEMESLWFKVTGHPFAMYMAECDLLSIIQNLQSREHQLVRLYNDGLPLSRAKKMGLHVRFFDDFGCRISDFYTNESFKRMIDDVIAESLV